MRQNETLIIAAIKVRKDRRPNQRSFLSKIPMDEKRKETFSANSTAVCMCWLVILLSQRERPNSHKSSSPKLKQNTCHCKNLYLSISNHYILKLAEAGSRIFPFGSVACGSGRALFEMTLLCVRSNLQGCEGHYCQSQ